MWKNIKIVLEIGVKSDPTFCLEPSIEKTNSDVVEAQTLIWVFRNRDWLTVQLLLERKVELFCLQQAILSIIQKQMHSTGFFCD